VLEAVDVDTGKIIDDIEAYFECRNRAICRRKICSEWERDKHQWESIAAAARYYAARPENEGYSDKSIAV
jgi:hypothetical protein